MIWHYCLIILFVFICETRCLDLISLFKRFQIDVIKHSKLVKSYNDFLEKIEYKNGDGEGDYPVANFTNSFADLSLICAKISKHIGATPITVSTEMNPYTMCRVQYLKEHPIDLHVFDNPYPGFMQHYLKNPRVPACYPVRVAYFKSNEELWHPLGDPVWNNNNMEMLDDLIFYDPIHATVHFTKKFGLLADMKEISKNSSTLPEGKNELTKILLQKRKKEVRKYHRKLLAYDPIDKPLRRDIFMEVAFYMGAIYVSRDEINYQGTFLYPSTGISFAINYEYNRMDMARYHKYFFQNAYADPFHTYFIGKITSNERTLNGIYPEDLFFYEVKHRTYGPLSKLNYGPYALRKSLQRQLMIL